MNIQSNKETAVQNEQQLNLVKINQNLSSINLNLKSIAESLDKISNYGVIINPTGYFLKNN